MADEHVLGKFKLTHSENFPAFLNALGVGYITSHLANKSRPTLTITKFKDIYTMRNESLVSSNERSFKLNEEFDEVTPDGRNVKTTMTLEKPNTIKHMMVGTEGGKDSWCVREFMKDKMKCICQVEDVVTIRHYKRVVDE